MGSGKTEQRTHCIHPIDENAKSLFSLVTNITRHGKYVCYGNFIGSRCKWNFVHWNRTKCCQPYARLCLNIRHIHSKWYPWSLTTGSPTWNYSTIHTEVDNLCGPLPALLGIPYNVYTWYPHFISCVCYMYIWKIIIARPGQQWSTKFHRWTLTHSVYLSFCVKSNSNSKSYYYWLCY